MDSRNWEQFKADNEKAVFIQNGEFCKRFIRDIDDDEVKKLLDAEDVPEWKKTGFNGCISCARFFHCKRVKKELKSKEE